MTPSKPLTLRWGEYEQIASYASLLEERSFIHAKWCSWVTAAKDLLHGATDGQPTFNKLSSISSTLQKRLEAWTIICTCAYAPGLKQLQLKLTFPTRSVVASDWVYSGDNPLLLHLGLQLIPAYDIITQYLKVGSPNSREMKPVELQYPARAVDLKYLPIYGRFYAQDGATGVYRRAGIPYAMSVFTTYAPFTFR